MFNKVSRNVVDINGEEIDEYNNNYNRNICETCREIMSVVFGQIGLLCSLIGYLIGGAYMFRYLELDNEYNTCNSKLTIYREKLDTSTKRVIGLGKSGLEDDEITSKISDVLIKFSQDMFSLSFSPRESCEEIINTEYGSNWNFINSLLFCATILTTVGYGQIAPKTFWGRLVCMFYSVIGIPLMLIYLSQIGQSLAGIFKFVYLNIICCRCCHDIIKKRRKQKAKKIKSLYTDLENHKCETALKKGLKYVPQDIAQFVDYDTDDEIDELDKFDDTKDFSVPITVSVGVIVLYIVIGSYLFPIWEDWSITDSAYFCFVTVATIGFGDLVPGMGRFDKPEVIGELIVCALYSLIGLSLISMCINLVQNEFVYKFRWLGKKLGLASAENEQDLEKETMQSDTSDLGDLDDIFKMLSDKKKPEEGEENDAFIEDEEAEKTQEEEEMKVKEGAEDQAQPEE